MKRARSANLFPIMALLVIASMILMSCGQAAPTTAPAPATAPAAKAPAATAPAAPPASAAATAPAAKAPAATSPAAPAAGTPKKGGTITMVAWQEPASLNQEVSSETVQWDINALVQQGLTKPNEKGDRVPVLAAEIPTTANGGVSADGKTITYKLRPNVKWHDGTAFTCDDVKFTFTAISTGTGAIDQGAFKDLASVDCPDPLTAVLKFANFRADWLQFFAQNGLGWIIPKSAGDPANMKNWAWNRKPIGTGPFKVDEWVSGDHITLSRNDNYWEQGKPYLDKVIVRFVPSSEVGKQLLKSGEADVFWNNTEADVKEIQAISNVTLSSAPQAGGERMILNLTENKDPSDNKTPHPILGDLNVRKAIALGIDRQTIIDKLLNGKALPGTSELNVDPFNCNIKPQPYDPAQAKQLLDQAGWVMGSDGIRAKNGVRLSLKYQTTSGNKLREDSQVLIVENMKAIGVEFKIENQPSSVLIGSWSGNSPRKHGNFDIIMYTTNSSIDPHAQMYNYFDSKSIPSPDNQGGINYSRWNDPQTDQLIEKAGSIPDWNQRKDLYCQAAQRVVDGYSHIYLYQRFNLHTFNNRVQGWIANPWMGPMWNAADIWVTK